MQHNLTLLRNLRRFAELDWPVLVGVSRKSMIGQALDRPVDQRLAQPDLGAKPLGLFHILGLLDLSLIVCLNLLHINIRLRECRQRLIRIRRILRYRNRGE